MKKLWIAPGLLIILSLLAVWCKSPTKPERRPLDPDYSGKPIVERTEPAAKSIGNPVDQPIQIWFSTNQLDVLDGAVTVSHKIGSKQDTIPITVYTSTDSVLKLIVKPSTLAYNKQNWLFNDTITVKLDQAKISGNGYNLDSTNNSPTEWSFRTICVDSIRVKKYYKNTTSPIFNTPMVIVGKDTVYFSVYAFEKENNKEYNITNLFSFSWDKVDWKFLKWPNEQNDAYRITTSLTGGLKDFSLSVCKKGEKTPLDKKLTMIIKMPPAPLTLVKPEDKEVMTTSRTVGFSWRKADDAVEGYVLQLAKNNIFTESIDSLTIKPDSTSRRMVLPEDGDYFWRMKALGYQKVEGSWSIVRKFEIRTQKPASPTFKSPSDNGTVTTKSPELKWTLVPETKKYWLQVSKDGNFPANNLQVNDSTITETSYNMTAKGKVLEEGVTYYWRLKSINQYYVQSDWAMSYQFTVHSNKPASPTLKSPSDKGTVTTTSPELTWSQVPAATKYWLQVSKDGNFPANNLQVNDSTITETSYNMTVKGKVLEEGITYYWQIKSINEYNVKSEWATRYQFTVHSNKPASPTLKSPSDKGTVTTTSPELTWSQVPAATKYWLQVSKDGNFPANNLQVNDSTITETSYNMTVKGKVLEEGITYYWQIKSINEYNVKSEWATRYQFTVHSNKPASPTLKSPSDKGTVTTTSPELTWSQVPAATKYWLQVSKDGNFPANNLQVNDSTITETSYNMTAKGKVLEEGVTYYWRLKSINQYYVQSDWAMSYQFTVHSNKPASPTLKSPSDKGTVTTTSPELTWSQVPAATKYWLQVSKDGNFPAIQPAS